MSNGSSAALALGLGVAAGAAVWFFTRDKTTTASASPPALDGAAASAPPIVPSTSAPPVGASPPRVPGPCSLKLDGAGLTADGERVDIPTAVARCRVAGKVEWAVMPDAPSAVVIELSKAIAAEKLPVTLRK